MHEGEDPGPRSLVEVEFKNSYDASEYADLEEWLRKRAAVTAAHIHRTRVMTHVSYDSSVITGQDIEESPRGCGYNCHSSNALLLN